MLKKLTTAAVAALVLRVAVAGDSTAFVPDDVARAVDTGAHVDARLPDGSTALQWAAYRGDASEVQRLIHAGANASVANNYGATAMSIAAEGGTPRSSAYC
jgi:ankyrin repeat protein